MPKPVTNPTAKARFLESSDSISKHRDLVDSGSFQRACDFAMLQFSMAVCTAELKEEEKQIGAAGLKLRGAHDFLSILRNLSEAPQKPSPIVRLGELNHDA
jgi:hypothetical protein